MIKSVRKPLFRVYSSESGDIKAYGSPKKSPAALNFALQIGMKGSKYRKFFRACGGLPSQIIKFTSEVSYKNTH